MLNARLRAYPRNARNVIVKTLEELHVARWMAAHDNFLLIFNWHQVSPGFDPHLHHQYTWTSLEDFAATIDYLAAHFRVVPLHEALEGMRSGGICGRCVALTFDDGDVSIADHIMPLLRRRNLPATFFINTAYLDGCITCWVWVLSYFGAFDAVPALPDELRDKAHKLRNTDDPGYYNQMRERVEQFAPLVSNLGSRLVSAEWLSGLDGDQFAIGAHGHEHQRFSMMSADWQRESLVENVRILSQFRAYKPIFAVPFGRPWDWTETTLTISRDLGLDALLADGGVNLAPATRYHRQPADSQSARDLIAQAIRARWHGVKPQTAGT